MEGGGEGGGGRGGGGGAFLFLSGYVAQRFSSDQGGIHALGKAHKH